MFKTIKIAMLRKAHKRAFEQAKANLRGKNWNVSVQLALEMRECEIGNKLALAINPNAILRAW